MTFALVCPKFPVVRLITFTELFAVVGRVLEETEDFKGEESTCEFFSIMLPLQEGWPNGRLILVPTDEIKLVEFEAEVCVWLKDERLDVVVPETGEKAEDDVIVGFGTRNA